MRQRWVLIPSWQRQLLLGLFLLFDAYLGLIHAAGIIGWTGLVRGELMWLVLALEMAAGGLILVRVLLSQGGQSQRWKLISTLSTPFLVALLAFGILEMVLSGLGRSATMNFNLASIGSSGLYWAAAYLSVAIGLTLTYKVQRFANFAQAEMMLVGAYVALLLMWSDRFFPMSDAPKDGVLEWELLIWAVISAFVVTGLVGVFIDRLIYKRLRKKLAKPQVMMIASLGVAMIIRAMMYMRFSARTFRFVPDRDWRLATSRVEVETERLQLHLGDRVGVRARGVLDEHTPGLVFDILPVRVRQQVLPHTALTRERPQPQFLAGHILKTGPVTESVVFIGIVTAEVVVVFTDHVVRFVTLEIVL